MLRFDSRWAGYTLMEYDIADTHPSTHIIHGSLLHFLKHISHYVCLLFTCSSSNPLRNTGVPYFCGWMERQACAWLIHCLSLAVISQREKHIVSGRWISGLGSYLYYQSNVDKSEVLISCLVLFWAIVLQIRTYALCILSLVVWWCILFWCSYGIRWFWCLWNSDLDILTAKVIFAWR